jgi:[acyl-carrier-protein] S-malonyltransferase
LSEHRLAFVFPAFVSEYPDDPLHHLEGFDKVFEEFLHQAAEHACPDLSRFHFTECTFLEDELKTQYITYVYSCALSSYLKQHGIRSSYSAGYSMGIYAAYYHSEVIRFQHGLDLISRAFHSIKKVTADTSFLMGTVIGLNHNDIHEIQTSAGTKVEITNQNSDHSFVIGGPEKDVIRFLEKAKQEGALSTRIIRISDPYHTSYINPPGADHRSIMIGIPFRDPVVPVVSLIDRRIIHEEQSLRDEIIRNLYTPMNWYRTQLFLQEKGVRVFIECGLGKGLTKNSRFVEGEASFLSADSESFLTEFHKIIRN